MSLRQEKLYLRWYAPNKVWVLEQPNGEQDIYLYPNGNLKIGLYDKEINANGLASVAIPIKFD